jgi:transposase
MGKLLSSKTRRSSNWAATLLRIAAVNVGRTPTALGAFYRRLAAPAGKAQALTATARKLAVLFYNAIRFGRDYLGPGADYYEERYRGRAIRSLHRRPAQLGLVLTEAPAAAEGRVS